MKEQLPTMKNLIRKWLGIVTSVKPEVKILRLYKIEYGDGNAIIPMPHTNTILVEAESGVGAQRMFHERLGRDYFIVSIELVDNTPYLAHRL